MACRSINAEPYICEAIPPLGARLVEDVRMAFPDDLDLATALLFDFGDSR